MTEIPKDLRAQIESSRAKARRHYDGSREFFDIVRWILTLGAIIFAAKTLQQSGGTTSYVLSFAFYILSGLTLGRILLYFEFKSPALIFDFLEKVRLSGLISRARWMLLIFRIIDGIFFFLLAWGIVVTAHRLAEVSN